MGIRVENPRNLKAKRGRVVARNRPLRPGRVQALAAAYIETANRLHDAQRAGADRSELANEICERFAALSVFCSLFPAGVQTAFFVAEHEIDYASSDCYAQTTLADALTAFDWSTIDDDSAPAYSNRTYHFYGNQQEIAEDFRKSRKTVDEWLSNPGHPLHSSITRVPAGYIIPHSSRRLLKKRLAGAL